MPPKTAKELYVPGQKLGPWVQTAAWELFKEAWTDALKTGEILTPKSAEAIYRRCLELAWSVHKINQEERPYDKDRVSEFGQ